MGRVQGTHSAAVVASGPGPPRPVIKGKGDSILPFFISLFMLFISLTVPSLFQRLFISAFSSSVFLDRLFIPSTLNLNLRGAENE